MNQLSRNKDILLFILLCLLFILLAVGLSHLPVILPNTKDLADTVLAGFWTAFFASLFIFFSYILSRKAKRENLHYNSLINLQTQLNKTIGIIKDNVYSLKDFRRVTESGNIYWGNVNPIIIDESHFENLFDLDLINILFTFYYQARKLNDDMSSIQSGYSEVKKAYIEKLIGVDQYVENCKGIANQIKILEKFNNRLLKDLLKILARVRIQTEKDKPITQIILEKLIITYGSKITVKEMNAEITKLRKELDETSKESREEIKEVMEDE